MDESERRFAAKFDVIFAGFKTEEELKAFVAAVLMAAKTAGLDIMGGVAVLSNMPGGEDKIDTSNFNN